MQLDALRKYAKARKWKIVSEVQDIGLGLKKRKKREELMLAARQREIDAILVWKLDRWGRSLHDLISTLNELSELQVGPPKSLHCGHRTRCRSTLSQRRSQASLTRRHERR